MNILTLDLEYSQIFHILPSFGITLGKSVYIGVHWLNFYLTLKHISTDYKAKCWNFYSLSMTLHQYPDCAYAYTFEINAFGYMYRKGLFKDKNKAAKPWDNTGKFVHSSWLAQFRPKDFDFMGGHEYVESYNYYCSFLHDDKHIGTRLMKIKKNGQASERVERITGDIIEVEILEQ